MAVVTPFRGTFDKNRGNVAAVEILATPQGAQGAPLFKVTAAVGGVNVIEDQTGNSALKTAFFSNARRTFVDVPGGQSFSGFIDGAAAVLPCPFNLIAYYSNPNAANVDKIYGRGLGLKFKDYLQTEPNKGVSDYVFTIPKNQGKVIAVQMITETIPTSGSNFCEVGLSFNGTMVIEDMPASFGYYVAGQPGQIFGVDVDPASTMKISINNDRNSAFAVHTGFRLFFDTNLR